ncbi:MAG TPA: ankyrin repeat domain-containing protein [Candidatus Binatia bacterium]
MLAAVLVAAGPASADRAPVELPVPKPEDLSAARTILRDADLLLECEKGNAEEVKKLLANGIDANAARSTGATALGYAIAGRHADVAALLLEFKADPNKTSAGLAPLVMAAENGDVATVQLLLQHGAKVDAPLHAVDEQLKAREGDTALMAAASQTGAPAVVRALLAAGADINARAANGKTALIQAVAADNVAVLKALLEAKPDLELRLVDDDADLDALTLAVGKSKPEMVSMLLDAGADATVKMDDEVTLLEFAVLSGQQQVAARLRKAGLAEPSAARLAELRKEAREP